MQGVFGASEYEYALEVEAAATASCVQLLGGAAQDDVLDVLREWAARGQGLEAQSLLTKAGLTRCVWSRVGD